MIEITQELTLNGVIARQREQYKAEELFFSYRYDNPQGKKPRIDPCPQSEGFIVNVPD